MRVILSLLMVVLPLIGIADAGYITYEHFSNTIPVCGAGFDCGSVLTSEYASIGPIPISVLGLLFYSTLFILGILQYLEVKIKKFPPLIQIYTALTTMGLLFSGYLIFLMAIVLDAWCLYCVISAGASALLFVFSWSYFFLTNNGSHYLFKTITHTFFSMSYQHILKPLLFLIDAETVHTSFTHVGKILGSNMLLRTFTAAFFSYQHPQLAKNFARITFPNPIGLAAGFDYTSELAPILSSVGFGFHTIGTITLEPYAGNQKPRLSRFPRSKALLVNKGLKNPGVLKIIDRLAGKKFSVPVGISIASTNKKFASTKTQIIDILSCFLLLEKSRVLHSYYELNISCPNTFGGEPFTTPHRLEQLLTSIDALRVSRPVFIKMPIDQTAEETVALLKVAAEHSVTGIILGNLTKDKQNPDMDSGEREAWKSKKGNVSGKPTFKKSNKLIRLARDTFGSRFVIIGCGGVFDSKTAQEKFDAGADLIQLITGMVYSGPQLIGSINRSLATKARPTTK